MRWPLPLAALLAKTAIDGAFLGGVAAIISAVGTFLLGVLAYRKGQRDGTARQATEAEAWRLVAERLLAELREDDGQGR